MKKRIMKRMAALLLILCLVMVCGMTGAESKTPEGKPYLDSSLYGNWPSERPGPEENFDLYVNFDFYREALDRKDIQEVSTLSLADQIAETQILGLCQDPSNTDAEAEILRILYGLFMDTDQRDREGLAPLEARVDRIKAAKTLQELTGLMQEEGFLLSMPFFTCSVQRSSTDPEKIAAEIIGRPILDDLPTDEVEADVLEIMKDTEGACDILIRMGYDEEEAARLVEKLVRYDSPYNIVLDEDSGVDILDKPFLTLQEIREKCDPLYAQLVGAGYVTETAGTEKLYQVEPFELLKFRSWYIGENLDAIKAAVVLSLYRDAVQYLDTTASWNNSAGAEQDSEHECYILLRNTAGFVLDQAYLKHFTSEERWKTVLDLFDELKEAMRERIRHNSWMDEDTKKKAEEKLDLIGIIDLEAPGGPFDFESLRESLRNCESLLDAAVACKLSSRKCIMRFAGQECIRNNMYQAGTIGVMATNGQYLPFLNMINIGAAALNDSMFDDSSRETLLGSIGHHLAHEISHAFDTSGAQQDASGQLPLYTEEVGKNFTEKALSIAGKMSRIELLDGVQVNGEREITEALADLTGVSLALELAKKTPGFDYDKFFRAYAKFFCGYKPDRQTIIENNRMDVHPAPYVRINYTVAQFDEFYETYPTVTEGTPMYVAPEDRELIW